MSEPTTDPSVLLTYDHARMRGKVTELEGAVKAAIDADQAEADSFFTDLSRFFKHGFGYQAAADDFQNKANALMDQAKAAMSSICSKADGKLSENAGVPDALEADSLKWSASAATVAGRKATCSSLASVPGWVGEDQERYALAVGVQAEALEELRGILSSTAQSCTAGATLNRAIFCAVGNGAIQATGRITGNQGYGSSDGVYYVRTANAIPVLEAFDDLVKRAISGDVASGSAGVLSKEQQHTMVMPNLLVEGGWPTGTSATGVVAAATGNGVLSDGEDAQTTLDAFLRMCMAGANL
ncbi:hypothetical protein [Tessaracoccus antarcticus]|uniref:Uncharacterized protein n=1 Tax=Tessaracoccus antarcticus TaxID=2479848 RepID=A0A3M0GFF2_9ACTN|nr:hypothetical protein [Tessaracoccus antarcticus]RMB61412.1 hypothetical protein EAX62_01785 [Tessaracoccus antarcticus]